MSEILRRSARDVKPEPSSLVLRGWWLIIARVVWITIAVAAIGAVVLATSRYLYVLQIVPSSDLTVGRFV